MKNPSFFAKTIKSRFQVFLLEEDQSSEEKMEALVRTRCVSLFNFNACDVSHTTISSLHGCRLASGRALFVAALIIAMLHSAGTHFYQFCSCFFLQC